MFYSQVTDMPSLLNYEQALEHYNTTVPIRGSDIRPICEGANGRRKKHMQICKRITKQRGVVIACRLHDTDLLEFHPNGDIFITTGEWCSQSSLHFINALLPRRNFGIWANIQNRRAVLTIEGNALEPERREYAIGAGLTLRHVEGTNKWEVTKSEPNYSYRARRKVMNEKMQPVKQFITACIAFSKLYDLSDNTVRDEFKPDGKVANWEGSHWSYEVLKDSDHDDYSKLVLSCLKYSYIEPDYWAKAKGVIPRFDPEKIKNFVREIVKYTFVEDIFECVEVDRISNNGNEKYFGER